MVSVLSACLEHRGRRIQHVLVDTALAILWHLTRAPIGDQIEVAVIVAVCRIFEDSQVIAWCEQRWPRDQDSPC